MEITFILKKNGELKTEKITKVGRKYFYAGDLKIDIDSMTSCSNYSSCIFNIYTSEEEFNNNKEYSNKMNKIERFFNWSNWDRKKITLDEIRKIYTIIEKHTEEK